MALGRAFFKGTGGSSGGGTGSVTSVDVAGTDGLDFAGGPITSSGVISASVGDPAALRTALNVADGATANSPDATLLDRANHTGTQLSSTISDFTAAVEALDDGRMKLTADANYHVNGTTGSDSNDGLTAGTAFATIGRALVEASDIDLGPFTATINVADGTYSEALVLNGAWLGLGNVDIKGNDANPENVIIDAGGSGTTLRTNGPGTRIRIFGVTLRGRDNLFATSGTEINWNNIRFEGTRFQLRSFGGVIINIGSDGNSRQGTLAASASAAIRGESTGQVSISGVSWTLVGTPAYSTAFVSQTGISYVVMGNNTFSGSATGLQYNVSQNSVLAPGSSAIPGSGTSTGTGGQVI